MVESIEAPPVIVNGFKRSGVELKYIKDSNTNHFVDIDNPEHFLFQYPSYTNGFFSPGEYYAFVVYNIGSTESSFMYYHFPTCQNEKDIDNLLINSNLRIIFNPPFPIVITIFKLESIEGDDIIGTPVTGFLPLDEFMDKVEGLSKIPSSNLKN